MGHHHATSDDPALHAERARGALRDRGIRATDQRVTVLSALMARHGDATAQVLHEQLAAGGDGIGLATVYRTLATLADAGVLDAMQHGHGTCYRWCSPGHHHHLTCDRCHRVVEVHECGIDPWVSEVAAANGFTGVRHVVELTGTCAECAAAG